MLCVRKMKGGMGATYATTFATAFAKLRRSRATAVKEGYGGQRKGRVGETFFVFGL